jgi:hypothetical protein
MWGVLKQNLSYSIRTMLKNLAFTLTAVLTLALGIGATTAIFSVVYAVFAPMPYPKPEQLMMVWSMTPSGRGSVSANDFLEWQQRSSSFQGMAAWTGASFNLATSDRPEQVTGSQRTPGFFNMEGLPFLLGRDFLPEEGQPGRDHVVMLSNRLWSRAFAADREIIGKDIRMSAEPYTVVGVLPPGIHDRFNSQLWVPLVVQHQSITELGAQPSALLKLVLKEGVVLAVAGGLIGFVGAYLVGRAMQSTLYGVAALDVRAFGAVFLLLLISSCIACLLPALRASRVEPLVALRDN